VKCDYSYLRSRPFCLLQINQHGLNRIAPGVSAIPTRYRTRASRLENCASVRDNSCRLYIFSYHGFPITVNAAHITVPRRTVRFAPWRGKAGAALPILLLIRQRADLSGTIDSKRFINGRSSG
jgi:hypothetical protein